MAVTFTWQPRPDNRSEALHISLAAGSLTLSFAGRSNLSFDGEGRLIGAWYDGLTYRRSLDNRVLLKWLAEGKPPLRHRRFLSAEERDALLARVHADVRRVHDALHTGQLAAPDATPAFIAGLSAWLDAALRWDAESFERDAAAFCSIYKPISILPPDQYLAVVLQATEGCSYNQCSFCTFYRDRPFRIKRPAQFAEHIAQVRAFLGSGMAMRKSVFLADANAVVIAQRQLRPLLQIVNQHFSFEQPEVVDMPGTDQSIHWMPEGINAFISAPDALRKSPQNFAEMAELHVRRLYVGLETGHDALRRFLRKPGTAEDVLAALHAIKQGGLHVGLIFMAGIGGEDFRAAHFEDTVDLIQAAPLGPGDLIYTSPFVASADSPYLDDMRSAGYSSLDDVTQRQEEERFRAALSSWARRRGVRVSRYDVREFIY